MSNMATEEFPYQKINFILSVIGFIGSLGFYYGVLKNIKNQTPEKKQISDLKKEVRQLKRQLSNAERGKK